MLKVGDRVRFKEGTPVGQAFSKPQQSFTVRSLTVKNGKVYARLTRYAAWFHVGLLVKR